MSKRINQPAAPANTIVTTMFLQFRCVVSVGGAGRFLHIRSAILNTSQPRAAKPTPHRSITETIAFLFYLQDDYDFTGRMQVTNC
jgi:hypothetical protein